jgi:hypothetical protein
MAERRIIYIIFKSLRRSKVIVAPHIGWRYGVMFRFRKRDWIILTAFIVVGAAGYGIYSKWTEKGLRRTEADMKSNLALRVDQNTTLVDVKYDRTASRSDYRVA